MLFLVYVNLHRIRGSERLRKKTIKFFINEIEWKLPQKNIIETASRPRRFDDREKNRTRELSPLVGESGGVSRRKGQA